MEKALRSEFHVVLNGIKLRKDAEARIEKGIRSLVAAELAAGDPDGGDLDNNNGGVFRIPRKWQGIIYEVLDKAKLAEVAKLPGLQINEGGFSRSE